MYTIPTAQEVVLAIRTRKFVSYNESELPDICLDLLESLTEGKFYIIKNAGSFDVPEIEDLGFEVFVYPDGNAHISCRNPLPAKNSNALITATQLHLYGKIIGIPRDVSANHSYISDDTREYGISDEYWLYAHAFSSYMSEIRSVSIHGSKESEDILENTDPAKFILEGQRGEEFTAAETLEGILPGLGYTYEFNRNPAYITLCIRYHQRQS